MFRSFVDGIYDFVNDFREYPFEKNASNAKAKNGDKRFVFANILPFLGYTSCQIFDNFYWESHEYHWLFNTLLEAVRLLQRLYLWKSSSQKIEFPVCHNDYVSRFQHLHYIQLIWCFESLIYDFLNIFKPELVSVPLVCSYLIPENPCSLYFILFWLLYA